MFVKYQIKGQIEDKLNRSIQNKCYKVSQTIYSFDTPILYR